MGFSDMANGLFDKGKTAFSEFADAAGDLTAKAKVKAQIVDQGLERDSLMKRLGEAVYEDIKTDERYAEANAELLAKIAEIDARKAALEAEYERLSAEERAKAQANAQQPASSPDPLSGSNPTA